MAADRENARERFSDFITSLEDDLENAERLGKNGDIEMLQILLSFDGVQDIIATEAEKAGELMPPENYQTEADKIAYRYILSVFKAALSKIKDSVVDRSFLNSVEEKNLDIMKRSILYYKKMYPELNLEQFLNEIDTIPIYVPIKQGFWSRFLKK